VVAAGTYENGVLLKNFITVHFSLIFLKVMKVTPLSPPAGEAPQGVNPLTPHLRVKTHKKIPE
jgi:hypothetical protein